MRQLQRVAVLAIALVGGLVLASGAFATNPVGGQFYPSSQQQVGNSGSWRIVNMNTAVWSNGVTVDSSGCFTVPDTAVYELGGFLTWDGGQSNGVRELAIFAGCTAGSGAPLGGLSVVALGGVNANNVLPASSVSLTAGSTFSMQAFDGSSFQNDASPEGGCWNECLSVVEVSPASTGGGSGADDDSGYVTTAQLAALKLSDLANVNASTPADGDTLTYDASTAKWVNKADTDSTGSGGAGAVCGGPGLPACMVDTSTGSGLDTQLNYIWWGIAILAGIVTFGLLVAPHWNRLFNWWGNPA